MHPIRKFSKTNTNKENTEKVIKKKNLTWWIKYFFILKEKKKSFPYTTSLSDLMSYDINFKTAPCAETQTWGKRFSLWNAKRYVSFQDTLWKVKTVPSQQKRRTSGTNIPFPFVKTPNCLSNLSLPSPSLSSKLLWSRRHS